MRHIFPGLAALPRPLQDLLRCTGYQAGGYQVRPAPAASVLLGEAEGRPRLPEDPATERSSGLCHVTLISPEISVDICESVHQGTNLVNVKVYHEKP